MTKNSQNFLEAFKAWYPDYGQLINALRSDGQNEGWWTEWDEEVYQQGMKLRQMLEAI